MHHVYVAKMRGTLCGIVKVGYSADVGKRMGALRSMLVEAAALLGVRLRRDPDPKVLRVLSFRRKSAADAAERDLKAHYWRHRLQGEYFRLPGREIARLARRGYVERLLRGYARWESEHGPKTLADFVALGLVEAKATVYVNWGKGDALRRLHADLRGKGCPPPPPEAYYLNLTPKRGENSPLLPWAGSVTVRPLCGALPACLKDELRAVAGKRRLRKASGGGVRVFSNQAFLHVAALGAWDKATQQANRSRAASGSDRLMPALASRDSAP